MPDQEHRQMTDVVVEPPARAPRLTHLQRTRVLEHYMFGATAVLFAAIVFAGFARSYYLGGMVAAPLPSWIVHVHGLLMTLWVALFAVQAALVSAKQIRVHQRLGYSAIGLAVMMCVAGIWTAIRAAKYGSASVPPGFSEPTFSIVPLGDIVLFALFFGGALYFRKDAATHKRLMLLTVLNFLPPAVGRLPIGAVQAAPIVWVLGIISGAALVWVAFDRWRYGRVNRVFLAGALILIASFPLRIALMGTQVWTSFSTWLATLA
jgi:hypothetical protein